MEYQKLRDRLYLPHQAAYEYQENRLNVISAQYLAYEDIPKLINDLILRISSAYPRHPFINTRRIDKLLGKAKEDIEQELNNSKEQHRDLIKKDDLRDKLDMLFHNNVGKPYDSDRHKAICSEADRRYQNDVPPGYKDNKKPEARKYGDVILWYQIKDWAKNTRKPIILITDDRKEDWWLIHKGRTIGPRPELIQEFKNDSGTDFYMYESDRFIEYAQKFLKLKNEEAVNEAREVKRYEQILMETQASALQGYIEAQDRALLENLERRLHKELSSDRERVLETILRTFFDGKGLTRKAKNWLNVSVEFHFNRLMAYDNRQ